MTMRLNEICYLSNFNFSSKLKDYDENDLVTSKVSNLDFRENLELYLG